MPSRKYRIEWSPESEDDLLTIWRWGASHFSPAIADQHLREIETAVGKLEESPLNGRARDELMPGIWAIVVYPTVLFYRVMDERVEIVRVIDRRRNIAAIFSGDGD
jgi:toxin ParE1/3/4